MTYRTYDEWLERGRQVQKGEVYSGKLRDGTTLFHKDQTKKEKPSKKVKKEVVVDRSRDSWDQGDQYDYS